MFGNDIASSPVSLTPLSEDIKLFKSFHPGGLSSESSLNFALLDYYGNIVVSIDDLKANITLKSLEEPLNNFIANFSLIGSDFALVEKGKIKFET